MIIINIRHQTSAEIQEIQLDDAQLRSQPLFLGRQPGCEILLPDATVSRKHAQLTYANLQIAVTDLHSSGGTFFQGAPLIADAAKTLNDGDEIIIGPYHLTFKYIEQAQDQTQFPDAMQTKLVTAKLPNYQPVALVKPDDWRYWDGETIEVTCSKIFNETHDVKTFVFTAAPNILFRYKPGQFATLHLNIDGKPVIRSYTISSTPSRPHFISVTVKQVPAVAPYPPGLVSNWLHKEFKVGQKIQISGPYGEFSCHSHPSPKLCLISGGSGVTPMLSMTRWLCDTASNVDIVFFHVAKTAADIVARDELEMLAARHSNLRLVFSVTQDRPPSHWAGWRGRISEQLLAHCVPDFNLRRVFVCGPEAFMASTRDVLINSKFLMHNFHEESFGGPKVSSSPTTAQPAPEEAPKFGLKALLNAVSQPRGTTDVPTGKTPKAQGPQVHFKKSANKAPCTPGNSILEIAEQCGVTLPFGCRQGMCGACKQKLVKGSIAQDGYSDKVLNAQDKSAGYILTCIAKPNGDIELDA